MTKREEFNSTVRPHFIATHTPQCQKCMKFHPFGNSVMEVHHIKMLVDGGSNDEDNLIVLCKQCHDEWHEHYENKDFKEWLQRPPLWMYSALAMEPDDSKRIEYLKALPELWPDIREVRMLKAADTDYAKRHAHEWVDW